MARGRFFLIATLSLSAWCGVPSLLRAEDSDVDSRHVFLGNINANSVYVRSRASEDAYPTMKLSKGMKVTVAGIKGQWLKIEPPEGSFAYVPKSFVILRGDGTVGRMNREWLAKAGSDLNDLAAQPLATVHEGEDVTIIGQHNEYFKIKPPKESYLWINKQFVDPGPELVRATPTPAPAPVAPSAPSPAPQPQAQALPPVTPRLVTPPPLRITDQVAGGTANPLPTAPPAPTATPTPTAPVASATPAPTPAPVPAPVVPPMVKAANPAETTAPQEVATAPTPAPVPAPATQPAEPLSAFAQFEQLEKDFSACAAKPIDQQQLPDLKAGYEKLASSDELPSSIHSTIDIRIAQLKLRNDARIKYLAVLEEEKKSVALRQSLQAEQQEIQDRIKKNDVQMFAAVGTLRSSSLQVGLSGVLYRLTDPANGRTVIYVRSGDPKLGQLMGQFIGVRGTIQQDMQLKSIIENPVECMPVDESKVNTSIAAQVVPPSLIHYLPASSVLPRSSPSTQPAGYPMHATIDLSGGQPEPQ